VIVTVWRHAEAGVAESDVSRPITPRGREALYSSGTGFVRWLEEVGMAPVSSLLYSPYLRARETAEVLSSLCLPAYAAPDNRLVPGARIEDVAELVDPEQAHMLLVSHQPLVSNLVALWCDDPSFAPLSPGGSTTMVLVSPERGGATLLQHCPEPVQSDL
jgi:phosphohistidine phosphatase